MDRHCMRANENGLSYSNTLGWHTFPVPYSLSRTKLKSLTRCAEDILLAREAHFPATIADLYDPENHAGPTCAMPMNAMMR